MNKQCYRVIFSEVQQAFVVVSELAKMQGKSKSEVNNKEKQTLNLP
ncbi:hypothetical protein GVX81_06650, partial [[Haemophilus] felis]|nr:hypothetical protein [[Haemophilus] felis]NBI41860.1 hypothetical protein [[Haemophilus] felis]NBI43669.1 hypothetical protein [[Haemophilus] felis]